MSTRLWKKLQNFLGSPRPLETTSDLARLLPVLTIDGLAGLPITDWNFSSGVIRTKGESSKSFLEEALYCDRYDIAKWLLIDKNLIVNLTSQLTIADMLKSFNYVDSCNTSSFGMPMSLGRHYCLTAIPQLDKLAKLPLAWLAQVTAYFWQFSPLDPTTKELFVSLVAYQHYVFAEKDPSGLPELMLHHLHGVDFHQVKQLLLDNVNTPQPAGSFGKNFMPIIKVLERGEVYQTMQQNIPSSSPVSKPRTHL